MLAIEQTTGRGVPGGADTAAPPIDLAHLARYTLGNRALDREILELFAGQAPQTIERLRAAETARQWHEAAHTMKGSARAVGAFALADLAETVERTHVWQSPAGKAAAIAAIEASFEAARAFIDALPILA